MSWGIPQWLMASMLTLSFVVSFSDKPKRPPTVEGRLLGWMIMFTLLVWGGYFG